MPGRRKKRRVSRAREEVVGEEEKRHTAKPRLVRQGLEERLEELRRNVALAGEDGDRPVLERLAGDEEFRVFEVPRPAKGGCQFRGKKMKAGEKRRSSAPLSDERRGLLRGLVVLHARRRKDATLETKHLRVDADAPLLDARTLSEVGVATDGVDGGAALSRRLRSHVEHRRRLSGRKLGRRDAAAVEELQKEVGKGT